jgi:predicted NAD-dependent protein-ADP-ribosyltransferase YbiA (DUF1768 family)
MDKDNTIYFYDAESDLVKKEHFFLNNFDPSEFIGEDGFKYPTSEHYYQCYKFDDNLPILEEIR